MNRSCCRCTFMPRERGGIGRTGTKHKKSAARASQVRVGSSDAGQPITNLLLATSCAQPTIEPLEPSAPLSSLTGCNESEPAAPAAADSEPAAPPAASSPPPAPPPHPEEGSPRPPYPKPTFPRPCRDINRLRGSMEAWAAIKAATECELAGTWTDEFPDERNDDLDDDEFDGLERLEIEKRKEIAIKNYQSSLQNIKEKFPRMVCCDDFEVGGCRHGHRCECGSTKPAWPWIVVTCVELDHGGFCDCHMYERGMWVWEASLCDPAREPKERTSHYAGPWDFMEAWDHYFNSAYC